MKNQRTTASAAHVAAAAKKEMNEIYRNPMALFNLLNKMAKKNEYGDTGNVCELARRVKEFTGEKVAYSFRTVVQDSAGKFCRIARYNGGVAKCELLYTHHGVYKLCPVKMNAAGVIASIASRLALYEETARVFEKVDDFNKKRAAAAAKRSKDEQIADAIEACKAGRISVAELSEIYAKLAA